MKVYVNGCSFSYGNTLENKFAWPDCLPYDVVNESWIAGSNKRIARRTIEYCSNNPVDIAIVQLTDPFRDEFYDEEFNLWIGMQGDFLHFDDQSINRQDINQRFIREKWQKFIDFNLLIRNEKTVLQERYYLINTLISYFNQNNIKYLITGMSSKCMPKDNELILNENYVLEPISHMIQNEKIGVNDNHPNEQGHKHFSRYIISEIEKRCQI